MSCRLGRVIINRTPPLSSAAVDLLQATDSPTSFRKKYGDYYVCGYELGADAGASLSATNKSSKVDETLALTIAVKVVFFESSATTTTTTTAMSSSSSMAFSSYSTLNNDALSLHSDSLSVAEQEKLRHAASIYLKKVGSLDHHARKELGRLGLTDGQTVPLSRCTQICKSGLVVQLLLAPFARLNEFVASALASGNDPKVNQVVEGRRS